MANHVRRTQHGWVADFVLHGKRRQLRAKTKAEAQQRMALELSAAEDEPQRAGGFTMEQARRLSLEVRWAGKACETTAAGYSADVVSYFGPDAPLVAVNAQKVEQYRGYLKAKGNAAASINWKVSCLQSMLRDAVLYGHLDAMPVLPKRLKLDNQKQRVLSEDEVSLLSTALQLRGHAEAADLLVFLVEVGCRWSEAEGLLAKHVSLERGSVLFPRTKNGKPRTVPLTSRALAVLERRMPSRSEQRVWGYSYKQFQHQWDQAKAMTGLAGDMELTVHTCRHTCCSRLAQRGIPLPQIMAWSGHRSLQSVARYLHLDITGLEAARAALEAM